MTQLPAPAAPAATAPAPAPAPTAPAPTPHQPDPDNPDAAADDIASGLSPQQQARAADDRLRRSRENWRTKAQTAEAELTTLRAQVKQLETQGASVAQLRSSLVASAIRAAAAGAVAPEALEDTIKLIDTADLTVGDDGTIDAAKVKAKVDEFVKARPHLAPGRSTAPAPLNGIHAPAARQGGQLNHQPFNDLVRQAAGRQ